MVPVPAAKIPTSRRFAVTLATILHDSRFSVPQPIQAAAFLKTTCNPMADAPSDPMSPFPQSEIACTKACPPAPRVKRSRFCTRPSRGIQPASREQLFCPRLKLQHHSAGAHLLRRAGDGKFSIVVSNRACPSSAQLCRGLASVSFAFAAMPVFVIQGSTTVVRHRHLATKVVMRPQGISQLRVDLIGISDCRLFLIDAPLNSAPFSM